MFSTWNLATLTLIEYTSSWYARENPKMVQTCKMLGQRRGASLHRSAARTSRSACDPDLSQCSVWWHSLLTATLSGLNISGAHSGPWRARNLLVSWHLFYWPLCQDWAGRNLGTSRTNYLCPFHPHLPIRIPSTPTPILALLESTTYLRPESHLGAPPCRVLLCCLMLLLTSRPGAGA